MHELNHTYATPSVQIRRAIESHKDWIEERLGVSLSDAAIIETDLSFCDAALPRLIGYSDRHAPVWTVIARLTDRIQSVEVPPFYFPRIGLERERAVNPGFSPLDPTKIEYASFSMSWLDCPVLLQIQDLPVPLVAFSVGYHRGPDSSAESQQDIVVIPRGGVPSFISLLKALMLTDGEPRLDMGHRDTKIVKKCSWDQLVLDPTIVSLLKDDFESFFEREDWFRKMRLPFRRGYLLHGPPGNGKSTAIRAMMTSQGLTAHTIRFFDDDANDKSLECLFERAAKDAPAIVLLEDIDRSFPRTGQSKTKVSLQQLLSCLDGVASGEGIITIATANDPTALDPAILRRPGRFDRVILFGDPTAELRRQYFIQMHPLFANINIDEAVAESAGFSFAMLREAFIMAAQVDFKNDREMTIGDLLASIWSLRGSLLVGNMKTSAGFTLPGNNKRGKHE